MPSPQYETTFKRNVGPSFLACLNMTGILKRMCWGNKSIYEGRVGAFSLNARRFPCLRILSVQPVTVQPLVHHTARDSDQVLVFWSNCALLSNFFWR